MMFKLSYVRFLGHYQPQQGKPALWELDSDQHHNVGRCDLHFADENVRYEVWCCLLLSQSYTSLCETNITKRNLYP